MNRIQFAERIITVQKEIKGEKADSERVPMPASPTRIHYRRVTQYGDIRILKAKLLKEFGQRK